MEGGGRARARARAAGGHGVDEHSEQQDRLERVFGASRVDFRASRRSLGERVSNSLSSTIVPTRRHSELHETEDAFHLTIEAPGVQAADVDIALDQGVISE